MKKFLIIYMLFYIFLLQSNQIVIFANNNYARATQSTTLYKSPNNDSISNSLCLVEKSYFVEIISDELDYYRVNYNGVNGYVKKDEVKKVTNIPSTPFPSNISMTIKNNCNLRSSPTIKSSSNNIIATLYSGEKDITFIGRIFSEEAIDFGGTTWYYVNYQGHYGYIYNQYIRSITPIYENTEKSIYLDDIQINATNPITHTPSLIIIIVLFIPCIFILLILYIPRKSIKKIKLSKKSKIIDKY